jgi:hypothetical protein
VLQQRLRHRYAQHQPGVHCGLTLRRR